MEIPADLVDTLHERGPGASQEGWVVVADEHFEKTRWAERRLLVLQYDGELWGITYELGATEYQEHDFPWRSGWDKVREGTVTLERVYPWRTVTHHFRPQETP